MKCDRICAGIVLFNPDIDRLRENIEGIKEQVEFIYLIDNCSGNIESIQKMISSFHNFELILNSKNEGIAFALNQIIHLGYGNEYDWVITLDQDSVCLPKLVECYRKYLYIENVGMITCEIIDRNYLIKKKNENSNAKYEFVRKCITSGCLTNIQACIEVGLFDEKLFIDSVDYDMCYSLEEHGYKILKINFQGLLHEVGKSKKYSLFGFEFAVNNHSPLRKYYISRNSTYLIRKHHLSPISEYLLIYRRIFTVFFFEQQKVKKVKAILKGIRDAKRMM